MKKRNQLDPSVNHLLVAFEEGLSSKSYFRVLGMPSAHSVEVPADVMRRLYWVGRAYGMRQLRCFEPGVKQIIGVQDVPALIPDLRRIRSLLNDEEAHIYIDRLLAELEAAPGSAGKSLVVSSMD